MKKLNVFFALAFVFLTAQMSFGQVGIVNSSHNFTGFAWNVGDEICKACHTPHTGYAAIADAPLWNHRSTVTDFTGNLYTSSTMDAVTAAPDASSKLCLSCHDGTIALDDFSGVVTGTTYITGNANMGVSLKNDHPISFDYTAALAATDGGLFNPAVALSGLGGTINDDMLIGGKMQCSSCHDVHNSYNISPLLKKTNASSALCLTCHNK